ncbi:Centromere-associated protein [Dirofilaria immitis]
MREFIDSNFIEFLISGDDLKKSSRELLGLLKFSKIIVVLTIRLRETIMETDIVEDSIKVVVRMRPPLARESAAEVYWKVIDNNTIVDGDEKNYTFDQVYREVDRTEDVYDNSVKDVVESAMAGYNGTLFAYGQTASGKTYTMFGTDNMEGIVQMALDTIFAKILEGNGKRYMLRMSCIEIYNEKVRDLLSDSVADLPVKEFRDKTVVDGLREEVIVCKDGVAMLIQRAFANRVIGETALNERSSRSHVILRFVIECYDDDVASDSSYISFLNVVDLAGSESAKQSGGDGDRLKESGKINTSLLALQRVINQLSEKGHGHVNFRDSKLTRLLKNSLGGNARTLIICTASPTEVTQTLQTLRFAVSAKKIKNKPRKNWNAEGMLTQYIQTIERLKTELEENRKNETVELELMNKNIELSKEVERLKKCILSSQVIPQSIQKHCDRRARRQTWGGNWARPGIDMLLPYKNLDPSVPTENPAVKKSRVSPINEISEQPETVTFFDASVVAFTTLRLDDDEADIATDSQTSNHGSNQMSGTESTVIETAENVENLKLPMGNHTDEDELPTKSYSNHIDDDEKLSTENCTNDIDDDEQLPAENCFSACAQKMNKDESRNYSEKENIDSKHSSPLNELKNEVIGLEATIAELKAENEYLKEELRCRNRDIGWLEKQCDDADNVETKLREQLYETQKIYGENLLIIARLRGEIVQMKNSMMASEAADIYNKENLFRLENEIKRKEKEMREIKGEIALKDRKIGGLLLELRRVMNKQENLAEKARFGENDNDNLSSTQIVNTEMKQKNRVYSK